MNCIPPPGIGFNKWPFNQGLTHRVTNGLGASVLRDSYSGLAEQQIGADALGRLPVCGNAYESFLPDAITPFLTARVKKLPRQTY